MLGIIVVLLAIAMPVGILVFAVLAIESERNTKVHFRVRRSVSMLVFGVAALAGVAWVFRTSGPEYPVDALLLFGIPVAIISALLAALAHPWLSGRSFTLGALTGAAIAFVTVLAVTTLFALTLAPKAIGAFVFTFGAALLLSPDGAPTLLLGILAGILLVWLSNRTNKRSKTIG